MLSYMDSETSTQAAIHIDPENALIDPNSFTSYTGEDPLNGKEFLTQEDAYNFYNAYARKIGFGIRKEAGWKSAKHGGYVSRLFVCNKAGTKKPDKRNYCKLVNHRPETRVGCSACMQIKLTPS